MIATREAPQIGYRNQYARTDAASNQLFVGDEIVECSSKKNCGRAVPVDRLRFATFAVP
jgi:hypothetical protein